MVAKIKDVTLKQNAWRAQVATGNMYVPVTAFDRSRSLAFPLENVAEQKRLFVLK